MGDNLQAICSHEICHYCRSCLHNLPVFQEGHFAYLSKVRPELRSSYGFSKVLKAEASTASGAEHSNYVVLCDVDHCLSKICNKDHYMHFK